MLHLTTNNDTNGNPRRVYVAIGPHGALEGAWDEGYSGREAVPASYRSHVHEAVSIEITPAEYRKWKRIAYKSEKPRPKHHAKPKRAAKSYKGTDRVAAASIFDEVMRRK